jgi:hypothetical protein
MSQSQLITDKAQNTKEIVRNDESATIPVGTPVAYVFDATDDGLAVVLPSTAGAAKAHTLFAGIVVDNALPTDLPKLGRVLRHGLCRVTKVMMQTRAASTDSFASYSAGAVGDVLVVNTVANCLLRTAAGAASAYQPIAILGETYASGASSASATSDTRTLISSSLKTFIRSM